MILDHDDDNPSVLGSKTPYSNQSPQDSRWIQMVHDRPAAVCISGGKKATVATGSIARVYMVYIHVISCHVSI